MAQSGWLCIAARMKSTLLCVIEEDQLVKENLISQPLEEHEAGAGNEIMCV
jgi:hypothetical protein